MTLKQGQKKILVGCGEWGFRDMPMWRHFEIARDFGFKYLEFGIGGGKVGRLSEAPSEEEIKDFVTLRERYQIATPFCCIENDFTLTDTETHKAMVAKVLGQMKAAAKCGATHVRLFAGFAPLSDMTESLWQQLLSALAECQIEAFKSGLTIAIETHGAIDHGTHGSAIHIPTVTTNHEGLARLLREMPKEIGINYDPGNIKAAEGNSSQLHLELLNSRINYCHLKDWKRTGDGWEACGVGDDDLDYGKLLPQMDFQGVYLIEYEPLHDSCDGIRRSLESLDRSGLVVVMAKD